MHDVGYDSATMARLAAHMSVKLGWEAEAIAVALGLYVIEGAEWCGNRREVPDVQGAYALTLEGLRAGRGATR